MSRAISNSFVITLLAAWLAMCGLASAHPMDEWFVNLEVGHHNRLSGMFRIPSDQVEQFKKTPVEFRSSQKALDPAWEFDSSKDEDGRTKVQLSVALGSDFEELQIRVPEGLLDDNQSLVGFLRFGNNEPTTILVAPGELSRFEVPAEVSEYSNSAFGFFKLGVTHIVEGYDHILFLFCLLIAGGTMKHFLVVVTAFTLGHSLTLAASVLGFFSLPSQLTETVIALSIVIAALVNIPWLKQDLPSEETKTLRVRGLMAGGFGLIHGLGFAGLLKEIGIQGSGVAAPLLGFNLGVEAGQLALVVLFYPILKAINSWSKRVVFLSGCSYLAAGIGMYWVIERLGLLG